MLVEKVLFLENYFQLTESFFNFNMNLQINKLNILNYNVNNLELHLLQIIIIAFVLWIIILNQSITIKFLNAVVSQINVIIKKINNFVSIIE